MYLSADRQDMNTAVVNIKVNPEIKKQAQEVAEELGLSLSSAINAFLRQLIRTRTVTFSVSEEPSIYMLKALKKSERDIKKGLVSPTFDTAEDAISWLEDPKATYKNGDRV